MTKIVFYILELILALLNTVFEKRVQQLTKRKNYVFFGFSKTYKA